MTKLSIKAIDRTLAKRQAEVAAARDKLDNNISELEGLRDSCRDAWDALQNARDALSELV